MGKKYKVTTNWLNAFEEGDIVAPLDSGASIDVFEIPKHIIENNPNWFEEITEDELEEGHWYWIGIGSCENDWLHYVTEISEDGKVYGYGFWDDRKWSENEWLCDKNEIKNYKRATHDEIEKALTKEAEKRGYKKGVRVKSTFSGDEEWISWNKVWYFDIKITERNSNSLWFGTVHIFRDGKWAKILDDKIEIDGHTIEVIKHKGIRLDCGTDVSVEEISTLSWIINHFDLDVFRNGKNITNKIFEIHNRI